MVMTKEEPRYKALALLLGAIVILVLVVPVRGCGGEGKPLVDRKTILRVQLFNVPENDSYLDRIEREFESSHLDVDLELVPTAQVVDVYNEERLRDLFGSTAKAVDLAEIDCLRIPFLVDEKLIQPWPSRLPGTGWSAAAIAASARDGIIFGVPHWLCGYFIFSEDVRITSAKSADGLFEVLRSSVVNPKVVGNLLGSWTTPSLFLDAVADEKGASGLAAGRSWPLDTDVLNRLKSLRDLCDLAGKNPCSTGEYKNNNRAEELFASGRAGSFFGYSERAASIVPLRKRNKPLFVRTAILGRESMPLVFTDSLVMRSGLDKDVQDAASRFSEYLTSNETYRWAMLGEDRNSRAPRYLLPARESVLAFEAIESDALYKQLAREVVGAFPFPPFVQSDVPEALRSAILGK